MAIGAKLLIEDFEFPLLPKESLDFGGGRVLARIDSPGGPPVYQDMGMDEATLDFQGTIIADNAWDVYAKLESKMWNGDELQLAYGDIQKRVRIKNHKKRLIRDDRIDYTLSLVVCFPETQLTSLAGGSQSSSVSASTTSSTAKPTLSKTMDRTYTVKSGDTLWGIASSKDVYHDGTKWEIIATANNISDPHTLQVGQILRIPSVSNVGASISAYNDAQSLALGTTGMTELQTIAGRAA